MSDAPRTFRPYHVHSSTARFLINGMIPALCVGFIAFVVWFGLRLDNLLPADATPEQHEAAQPLFIALMALLATMPMSLGIFWIAMRREIFGSSLELNAEGIVRRKGSREKTCRWNEVREVRTRSIGRIQIATVIHARGKIRFDSSYVDEEGPVPQRRLSKTGEYLEYPDGSTHTLKIADNEAYQLIMERAPLDRAS